MPHPRISLIIFTVCLAAPLPLHGQSPPATPPLSPEASKRAVEMLVSMDPATRRKAADAVWERSLKPGGILLVEAYTLAQLPRTTGGPKDPDMLMSCALLEREFPHCEPILSREIEREVNEGKFHYGLSSVVQFIARKKA